MPMSHDDKICTTLLGSISVVGFIGIVVSKYFDLQKAKLQQGISVTVESLGDRELWALGNRIDQEKWWRVQYGMKDAQQPQQSQKSSTTTKKTGRISIKTENPYRHVVVE
ncbi:hypothetical protein Z517_11707 [Fonsecaea pedrosoi CBS 271.37]|uniref:Uncharacterized protein n=1 Tax=Fonsecaea pedrosoi CBS 271.37 TaxID=1442368 RepID=A0A0D2DBH0_9EURO|nr:uncharacterized protein Z517_11707 [Fonsecaea pedrosoi CBS 271.37]KIW74936.1 hypothetical protein Z517_11707 [Fonsecaea pedrosoi CBS 271.37]